jgi:hypothetical protein
MDIFLVISLCLASFSLGFALCSYLEMRDIVRHNKC